ncbi:MAG: hypothetical protein J5919_03615, partial [Clostridia bacterium]|nr:hypothetical protein [Clostridia bacterium]
MTGTNGKKKAGIRKIRSSFAVFLAVMTVILPLAAGCTGGSQQAEDTTVAPVDTTAAPADTTSAPAETTAAPVETTSAPEQTSSGTEPGQPYTLSGDTSFFSYTSERV